MQRAANIEQRYFCRRKIDVFVHICVYAQNKKMHFAAFLSLWYQRLSWLSFLLGAAIPDKSL